MLQISENIRLAREAAGKTQVEMAKLLGIPRTTYINWEKDTEPTVSNLTTIAEILGVQLGDLINSDISPGTRKEEIAGIKATLSFLISELKVLKSKVFEVSHSKISLEVDRDLKQWTKQLVDEANGVS